MNCSEKRKAEILEEISKRYPDYSWVSVDMCGAGNVFKMKPKKLNICWNSDTIDGVSCCNLELQYLAIMLEISTDWEELCFELPKHKIKFKSDVCGLTLDRSDKSIKLSFYEKTKAHKIYHKLNAQQKIYDIIANAQYELDPEWKCCWLGNQSNYFLYLNLDDLNYTATLYYMDKDNRLYMSYDVAKYILDNNLITTALWLEAFKC